MDLRNTERRWAKIPETPITADGTEDGIITIEDTAYYKVKMFVVIKSDAYQPVRLQIQRVISSTELVLGLSTEQYKEERKKNPKTSRIVDVSRFTVADNTTVLVPEQERPNIPPADYERAVYEEEPIMAKRTIPVDRFGNTYGKSHEGQQQIVEGSITGSVYNNLKLAYNATLQVEYIAESPFATLDSENRHFIQKIEYDSVLNATRILLATSAFENPEIRDISISAPYIVDGDTFVNLVANVGSFQELEPTDSGGTGINGAKLEEELTNITINTSLGLGQTFSGKITEIISNQEVVIKIDSGTPVAETTVATQGDIVTKPNGETSSLLNRSWDLREGYVYRVREDE
jgi:hypothetical protein